MIRMLKLLCLPPCAPGATASRAPAIATTTSTVATNAPNYFLRDSLYKCMASLPAAAEGEPLPPPGSALRLIALLNRTQRAREASCSTSSSSSNRGASSSSSTLASKRLGTLQEGAMVDRRSISSSSSTSHQSQALSWGGACTG
jgi:hypothetical protein